MTASTNISDSPNTPAYYDNVAHQLEQLAEYARTHKNVDCGISERLKAFADGVRQDIRPRFDANTGAE
jgi:hypothetical protein